MSTLYSDNYSRFAVYGKKGYPGFQGFEQVGILETYEAVAAANPSTIFMFVPPAGAKFRNGRLFYDALGGSVTLSVGVGAAADGTVASAAKFLAATSVASAGSTLFLGAATDISLIGYEFDGQTAVTVTVGGAAATGTIKVAMDFLLAF